MRLRIYQGLEAVVTLHLALQIYIYSYNPRSQEDRQLHALAQINKRHRRCLLFLRLVSGITHKVEGLEHLKSALTSYPTGCIILAGNHQSPWDTYIIPLILAGERQVWYVTGRSAWKNPIVRYILNAAGYPLIDRTDRRQALLTIKEAGQEAAGKNYVMVIFPEGTRMPPGKIGKFEPAGLTILSRESQCIVPFVLDAGKRWQLTGGLYAGKITIKFLQPVSSQGPDGKGNAKEAILQIIDALRVT